MTPWMLNKQRKDREGCMASKQPVALFYLSIPLWWGAVSQSHQLPLLPPFLGSQPSLVFRRTLNTDGRREAWGVRREERGEKKVLRGMTVGKMESKAWLVWCWENTYKDPGKFISACLRLGTSSYCQSEEKTSSFLENTTLHDGRTHSLSLGYLKVNCVIAL